MLTPSLPLAQQPESLGSSVGNPSLYTMTSDSLSAAALSAASVLPQSTLGLFILFCTTELKIVCATPACHPLTGYHPHELIDVDLLAWLHPADRYPVEVARSLLLPVRTLTSDPLSKCDTRAEVMMSSDGGLQSPATGARGPYPNQTVRILRSNNTFALFNLRMHLHLSGGLRGWLWEPRSTLGDDKVYVRVLCHLMSHQHILASTRHRDCLPPRVMPITRLLDPSASALPSFASVVGAAAAPSQRKSRYYSGSAASHYSHFGTSGPLTCFHHRSTTRAHRQGLYPPGNISCHPPQFSTYCPTGENNPHLGDVNRRRHQAPLLPDPLCPARRYPTRPWEL